MKRKLWHRVKWVAVVLTLICNTSLIDAGPCKRLGNSDSGHVPFPLSFHGQLTSEGCEEGSSEEKCKISITFKPIGYLNEGATDFYLSQELLKNPESCYVAWRVEGRVHIFQQDYVVDEAIFFPAIGRIMFNAKGKYVDATRAEFVMTPSYVYKKVYRVRIQGYILNSFHVNHIDTGDALLDEFVEWIASQMPSEVLEDGTVRLEPIMTTRPINLVLRRP